MMGHDCERIFTSINKLKDELTTAILNLSSSSIYQIESETTYVHPHDSEGHVSNCSHGDYKEKKKTLSTSSFISSVLSAYESLSDDSNKLDKLESEMFVSSTEYNNSYGSPWTEIQKMQSSIEALKDFKGSMDYISDKFALLGLLNIASICTVDAKWALVNYHDSLQRGYDTNYNNNEASVTFKRVSNKDPLSIGNIKQDFDENVHIRPDTLDPF